MRGWHSVGSAWVAGGLALAAASPALAEKQNGPGATDTEVKVGNFVPYSGPVSAYGTVGKVEAAYVRMLNEQGGINGRKINFISYDDAYSPPKAVEQTRKLVESDEVLFLFQTLGTASNSAIMKYVNAKKVPHLFLSTGGTKFGNDPKQFPWTIPFNVSYETEGRAYANLIKTKYPDARIAVLVQNDDYGKDIYKGVRDGLGDKVSMIVAEAPYDLSEATVDSQMVKLKASGADLFMNLATPKFAAQATRKLGELNWKPVHILNNVAAQVGAVLIPAGLANAQGAMTATYIKDPTDPAWADDPGVQKWKAFMDKYYPEGDRNNSLNAYGYAAGETLEYLLRRAGDNLTRENVMKVANSIDGFAPTMLMPGIKMKTSATDHFPIEELQLMVFKGDRWIMEGGLISGEVRD
ncbi:ABC transporter substrate-binding protein [Chelatococcus reniformis]|uniref:Branched-chain amino acid ABC transporter substrate-binding protein n=1 Tax=Chelatococcus reniformis TaxID=1494448 RepID=A0A916TY30_9HYPH|nr:ABC transporter substrate-binding protein [Chelatococcus reniformis]GGC49991.1 branched-chain amino acid ABC transporter substrate-binding protein [Chelatococcus reniformis]